MAGEFVSVAEAAAMLDVHPQRVHERIREGSLPAEKVGHQWAVERDDLRRIMNHTGPGRPLSSKSAWDLLAVATDGQAASELSPSARSRASVAAADSARPRFLGRTRRRRSPASARSA
ncbi:MAG TPA: helix-turn-helix domain-containing protein [Dermatophilaceae bacterium]